MHNVAELIINPKFQKLLPRLSIEEIQTLRESIRLYGCRDPIVTWNNMIIDGHNRYSICSEGNSSFEIVEMDFESEEDAIVWIIDNQKGRRNLSDGWKADLAMKKKAILAERGREKLIEAGKSFGKSNPKPLSIVDKGFDDEIVEEQHHNTREEIAKDLGWSTGKTAKADYVWTHGDEQLIQDVKDDKMSINKAYNLLKEQEKEEIDDEEPVINNKKAKHKSKKPKMVLFPLEPDAMAVQIMRSFKAFEVERIIDLLEDAVR